MATSWIADYKLRTADRAALKDLSALNDDLLKDLGLTRADVHRAKQTPWERNPVGELANIARRRGNW